MKRFLLILIASVFVLTTYTSIARPAYAETAVPCPKDFYSDQDIRFWSSCASACEGSVSLSGTTNKEKIWSWLIAKGMTPEGAAGIMGNMNNESGFSPLRFQGSATNEEIWQYDGNRSGYNGNAWGLVQWDGGRRVSGPNNSGTTGILDRVRIDHPDWVKFIDKKYGDTADSYTLAESEQPGIVDQFISFSLDFMYAEASPGGNRSTVWEDVKAASSVLDATVIFHNDFEGSADSPEQVASSRGAAAQAIFDSLNGQSAATGGGGSSDCNSTQAQPISFVYYSQFDARWRSAKVKPSAATGEGGSMAADGCGPTADAMVIASLSGDASVTPVTIAKYADDKGYIVGEGANSATNNSYGLGSNSQLSIDLATDYKLSREDLGTDINKIAEYVKGGGLVVMSGRSGESNDSQKTIDGPFSAGGHYVVVKSVTADGKLIIANPYSNNNEDGSNKYVPAAGHPQPWPAEQTFDVSHFSSVVITGAYGFKKG